MIERHPGYDWAVVCDECPDSFEDIDGELDFLGVVREIKSMGWRVAKDEDGEWVHICPDCQ